VHPRIHKELIQHLSSGGRIDFAIAVDVALGVDAQRADLRWKSTRRLAENPAVLQAQMDGSLSVLNIDADLGVLEADE
jgi:hypothetical protein